MYSKSQIALKFLNYHFTALNSKGHGTHSPFVFHFIKNVLNNKQNFPEYKSAEDQREKLLADSTLLTIEDFGAGSTISKSNQRTVASIAKNAAKPKKFGQLLFRMVKEYQPQTILELGTSLGVTTSYLSLAKPDAKIITLEGSSAVADKAKQNFRSLHLHNISLIEGNFDETLATVISGLSTVDFCFIDGNHRREPTERYFQQLLTKTTNDSILIFDDIHWSREMEDAWQSIKTHPSVTCSIDLFFIGIILFRKEFFEKQDFIIRF
jgi:predicted O-methyltransferase YrrM